MDSNEHECSEYRDDCTCHPCRVRRVKQAALERLLEKAEHILAGDPDMIGAPQIPLSPDDARTLSSFVVAVQVNDAVELAFHMAEHVSEAVASVRNVVSRMSGGGDEDAEDDDPADPPEWVSDLLGIPGQKKSVMIRIVPEDGGPIDAKHVEIVSEMRNGASLEEVNRLLAFYDRPARAEIVEDL